MLSDFIVEHNLPSTFASTARQWFVNTANQLSNKTSETQTPFFLGINGCQGSGKSTLANFLNHHLSQEKDLAVVNLSLDDFYLSQEKRAELAKTIHPLLATRGVPGTHDTELLADTLSRLKKRQPVALPRFDKAQDNPIASTLWQLSPTKVDIVIIEGWCWGVEPQNSIKLKAPINQLEQTQDCDGQWRHYVNQQLANFYQPLYQLIDKWLMLKAPSFDCVATWRWQQEQHLAQTITNTKDTKVMSKLEVETFICYFQRLTEHALATLPDKCDLVYTLNQDRKIESAVGRI
ncbi:kinase [Thalassotalea sp. M1531]|uniref:Kinase n=1 Tax=Thalassotalea algicola TaxID=2716224 RepID=A0A7Y0L9K4_9GAMM|nr:P-loop NTPase fold protein [Thalassotalea algicola]NMP30478.1 kinase [Thalassotalea algicola]